MAAHEPLFGSHIQRTGERTLSDIEALKRIARTENTAAVIAQLEAIEKTAAAAREQLTQTTDTVSPESLILPGDDATTAWNSMVWGDGYVAVNSGQTEAEAV